MSFSLFTAKAPPRPYLLSPPINPFQIGPPPSNLRTLFFSSPSSLAAGQSAIGTARNVTAACQKKITPGMKEQKWTHEGLIVESLPNGMFRVKLDNEDVILGYISGKIRKNFIRMLPGDKVQIEVSRYDSTRGRITYRLRNRESGGGGGGGGGK